MNKTTIKISVLAFLGFMTYGYAQQQQQDPYKGKVGVNTIEPSATMDVQPNSDNARVESKTNEGIIAPKLSKTRIANIETPVEGTLVYATDETTSPISAYTGGDTKVAKITEKGYYFYNGTEWVKAGSDEELWKYSHDDELTTINGTTKYKFYSFIPSIFNGKTSMLVNTGEGTPTNPSLPKTYGSSLELHRYSNQGTLIGSSTLGIEGMEIYRDPVGNLSATTMGYLDFKSEPLVDYSTRIRAINHLVDTDSSNDDRNKAFRLESKDDVNQNTFVLDIDGRETKFSNSNYIYSFGKSGALLNAQKAVASNNIGNYVFHRWLTRTGENNTGNRNYIDLSINRFQEDVAQIWKGTVTRLQKSIDETKMGFIDFGINGMLNDININNGLGFGYNETLHAVIRENGNVGVGTTTPSEKLDVAGSIKSTALAGTGNRPVYADAEGKLVIGTASTTKAVWTPDTSSNSVKLAITSANGDRTTHPISITDEGMVRATSFQGVNGATIFPDYVFQKYYTGTSSIKADYNFKSLSQVEDFVKTNGHLPGYKSAATIKAQGYVDLMETQLTNVEKIEELYLHSIEQDKALKAKDAEIADLKQRLERLEKLIQ